MGGNMEASDKFYEYLSNDNENKVLKALNDILNENFEILKKKISEKNDSYDR